MCQNKTKNVSLNKETFWLICWFFFFQIPQRAVDAEKNVLDYMISIFRESSSTEDIFTAIWQQTALSPHVLIVLEEAERKLSFQRHWLNNSIKTNKQPAVQTVPFDTKYRNNHSIQSFQLLS